MFLLKLVRGAERASGVQPMAQVSSRMKRFVIGRDPKCEWPIPDRELALSARHCEIVLVNGQQVLRDLSTNGTFMNGSRKRLAGDHPLRHGDRIGLGHYLIEVSLVSDTEEAPAPNVARTRMNLRGGDPAAMVGTDWQQIEGPGAAPSLEMNSGFTRISKPWLDTSAEALSSVFATVPNVRTDSFEDTGASAAAPLAPDLASEFLRSLARGLGVPPESLGNGPPAETAHRVGRLLRVAMFALHNQLKLQSVQMNALHSRTTVALANSPAARLRLAPGPEEAVHALLASPEGEAMLVRAHGELGHHTRRILVAFEATCQRLGKQLDPSTLEQLAQGSEDPARLWQTYEALWLSLGMGEDKAWSAGFVQAADALLAAAYDEAAAAGGAAPPS
jgi:predicted component of type VI protein secretion system